MSVAKKSSSVKILKIQNKEEAASTPPELPPFHLTPFLFGLSRTIEAKNENVTEESNGMGARVGANLDSKYYSSQAFFETGEIFSRTDIGIMKILSPHFLVGAKFLFASAKFSDTEGTARINGLHALVQATGKYETENGIQFNLNGAATVKGSFLATMLVKKSWVFQEKYKLSPTIGYEELLLKSSETRLKSKNFLAGMFVEFAL